MALKEVVGKKLTEIPLLIELLRHSARCKLQSNKRTLRKIKYVEKPISALSIVYKSRKSSL